MRLSLFNPNKLFGVALSPFPFFLQETILDFPDRNCPLFSPHRRPSQWLVERSKNPLLSNVASFPP